MTGAVYCKKHIRCLLESYQFIPQPMTQDRREFLQKMMAATAGLGIAPQLTFAGAAQMPAAMPVFTDTSMVGIQMAAHSLFDEGLERTLDFLRDKAAVNTVMIYSHTYYGIENKPFGVLAKDHYGKEPRDLARRKFPYSWVMHHEEFFKDTALRHAAPNKNQEFYNREIFKEIAKPARDRGIKVFARMLEAGDSRGSDGILNYDKVKTVTVFDQPGQGACWNNPDYRNWLYATMEDMFQTYELDGLQYGAERTGPLSLLLYKGTIPSCFCEHCKNRNRSKGIDPERAKEGYKGLYQYIKKVEAGQDDSVDTVMVNIFKYFQRYPEILGWNYQWFQADEEISREMYERVKKVKPAATVGRHVDHQRSSWDMFYRSAVDYSEMAPYTDFIKPILYHDIYGPRLRWWVIEEWQKRIFNDLTHEQALEVFYAWLGYSKAAQVPLEQLEKEGMGAAYVYDETRRCVADVKGKVPVIAGIGLDVIWHAPGQGPVPYHSDPEKLQQAVAKAVEAGASGLLASREYDEMRHSSLKAFGDAVRQLKGKESSR
jgi:hypothetical protein